jgi:hypothetical protein
MRRLGLLGACTLAMVPFTVAAAAVAQAIVVD